MSKQELAVQCKGVVKTYGTQDNEVQALRGIDLEVNSGELIIVAGPSGCGKTTLISIIAGILDQTGGTCRVYDTDVHQLGPEEKIAFRAKNIGFVFQAFNLMPTLTSAENVAIPLIIAGMDRREATQKGAELLGQMGLADKASTFPIELSGGQQQRVAIARALIHDPKLIVCDEPTSALDGETGHKIMELMKKMVLDQHRTLIVVTHDTRIFGFANRIATMEDGHVLKIVNSIEEFEK
jgi:putative ABC transport system ATP-binding protein